MLLHRHIEPWLRARRFRRKSLVKLLAAELLEPRHLLTDAIGLAPADANSPPYPENYATEELWLAAYRQWQSACDPGSTIVTEPRSVTTRDPDALPSPEDYPTTELWQTAYDKWLIDRGFTIDSPNNEPSNRAPDPNAPPDPTNFATEDEWLAAYMRWQSAQCDPGVSIASEPSSVTTRDPDAVPSPEDYPTTELWQTAYDKWLIDHGFTIDSPNNEPSNRAPDPNAPPDPTNFATEDEWLAAYVRWQSAQCDPGVSIASEPSSVTTRDPDAVPSPEDYPTTELWQTAYDKWLIDHGFTIDSPNNEPSNRAPDPNAPPDPTNFATEDEWLAAYVRWQSESNARLESRHREASSDSVVVLQHPHNANDLLLESPADDQFIGLGITTDDIRDRSVVVFASPGSDSALGKGANSGLDDREDSETLRAIGDPGSDVGRVLELDAALSHPFVAILAE